MEDKIYVLHVMETKNDVSNSSKEVFTSFDQLWLRFQYLTNPIKNNVYPPDHEYRIDEFNCLGCTTFTYDTRDYKYELWFNKNGQSVHLV